MYLYHIGIISNIIIIINSISDDEQKGLCVKYICFIDVHLPLICVCQTASPTPQSPDMVKNSLGLLGWGRHTTKIHMSVKWTTKPNAIKGNRPMYFMIVPNSSEQTAFTTPKQIITYPTDGMPKAQDTYAWKIEHQKDIKTIFFRKINTFYYSITLYECNSI